MQKTKLNSRKLIFAGRQSLSFGLDGLRKMRIKQKKNLRSAGSKFANTIITAGKWSL